MTKMTDEQKHAEAQHRGYPHAVFLGREVYKLVEEAGGDMTCYVIHKPIPKSIPVGRKFDASKLKK